MEVSSEERSTLCPGDEGGGVMIHYTHINHKIGERFSILEILLLHTYTVHNKCQLMKTVILIKKSSPPPNTKINSFANNLYVN